MKKLLVILFAVAAVINASAQKRAFVTSRAIVAPRPVYVAPRPYYSHPYYSHPYYSHPYYSRPYVGFGYGLGFGYNPFFYGGIGYPYYGYPGYYNRPPKLDRNIMDIENDYSDRIKSARLDKSLTGHQRRQEIRELRRERKQAVYDAKRNYYKQPYDNNSYNNNY